MKRYRSKPVEVEAYQWNGERPLPEPLVDNWNPMCSGMVGINCRGFFARVEKGNWVFRKVGGQWSVCSDKIFKSVYEPVEG